MKSDEEILDIWDNRSYEYCNLEAEEKIRLIDLLNEKEKLKKK